MSALPAMCPLVRTSGGVSTSGRTFDVPWRGEDGARNPRLRFSSFNKWEPSVIISRRHAYARQRRTVDVSAAVALDLTPSVGAGKDGSVSSPKADKLDFFYTERGQKEWVC